MARGAASRRSCDAAVCRGRPKGDLSDPSAPPLVEAVDVSRTFHVGHGRARREIRALDGVSLSAVADRTHAIVGESGAGDPGAPPFGGAVVRGA